MILTPATLERLPTAPNARLPAQATTPTLRLRELKEALVKGHREIANFIRAIAQGNFPSLETALKTAETRGATPPSRAR